MEEEPKRITVMEYPLSYSLSNAGGQEILRNEAQARLDEENLSILPSFGEALFLPLRDIVKISEADYKIHFDLTSKEKLTLFDLGYRYDISNDIWFVESFSLIKVVTPPKIERRLSYAGIQAPLPLLQ